MVGLINGLLWAGVVAIVAMLWFDDQIIALVIGLGVGYQPGGCCYCWCRAATYPENPAHRSGSGRFGYPDDHYRCRRFSLFPRIGGLFYAQA